MSGIRLIVGLGNPGTEYENTRHNAGFWFVDQFLALHQGCVRAEGKFFGELGRLALPDDAQVWLLKPMTFMNVSGQAVAALSHFYKILPEEILVVHDELDLPPGIIRFKQGGGHGGHNGLKDIIARLGSPHFWRLRLGIGHPGNRHDVIHFVLKPPRADERRAIDDAIDTALAVLPLALAHNMPEAMRRLHSQLK